MAWNGLRFGMARLARIVAPGVAHHITQRGNRRQKVFSCRTDYQYYLDLLSIWSVKFRLSVLSYCLMPNHVHLIIIVPSEAKALGLALREIHQRYTRAVNFREKWRGHLWQGRFASCPMSEQHLHHALRYVEMNPVRAGLAGAPEQWEWSSAGSRINNTPNPIIDFGWLSTNGINSQNPSPTVGINVELFRKHERTGRPLGDDAFISKLEQLYHHDLAPQKPGPKQRQ